MYRIVNMCVKGNVGRLAYVGTPKKFATGKNTNPNLKTGK